MWEMVREMVMAELVLEAVIYRVSAGHRCWRCVEIIYFILLREWWKFITTRNLE